jgi:transcriptional regulator with XRE-family HTH domain
MPAPKGNQNAKGNRGGRPTLYKPAYAAQAAKACQAGFTDQELADLFGVAVSTISAWKAEHVEFSEALKAGKAEADDRVERALYHRAIGYSHEVEKPMVVDKDVRIVTYTERMPPDTTACIFWLKNRNPEEWRDKTQVEPSWAGKKPSEMTNEELDAAYLALLPLLPSPETVN